MSVPRFFGRSEKNDVFLGDGCWGMPLCVCVCYGLLRLCVV